MAAARRMVAPILPVTADELWRHLPAFAGKPAASLAPAGKSEVREESVHLADFPRGVDALADAALDAEWDRLRTVRDAVNRALEAARQNKVIGTSLGAHVLITAGRGLGIGWDGDVLPRPLEIRRVRVVKRDTNRRLTGRPTNCSFIATG